MKESYWIMLVGEDDIREAIDKHGSLTVFDDKEEAQLYLRSLHISQRRCGNPERYYILKDTE